MIKDMRRELASCQQDSWRMDEVTELSDMKERLMMSMLPTHAAAGGDGQPETIAGGFAALDALNDEMDEELDALMEKLGSVKHQFSSLDAQRRALQVRPCVWGAFPCSRRALSVVIDTGALAGGTRQRAGGVAERGRRRRCGLAI